MTAWLVGIIGQTMISVVFSESSTVCTAKKNVPLQELHLTLANAVAPQSSACSKAGKICSGIQATCFTSLLTMISVVFSESSTVCTAKKMVPLQELHLTLANAVAPKSSACSIASTKLEIHSIPNPDLFEFVSFTNQEQIAKIARRFTRHVSFHC